MKELILKYIDGEGEKQRVSVEQDEFVIGRHSENDLSINVSNLSREHLKIQRFAEVFIVSDLNSSNGTKINGEDLDEPTAIENGDSLNLGGFEIEVEFPSDAEEENTEDNEKSTTSETSKTNAAGVSSSSGGMSGVGKALIFAPILGLFILVSIFGAVFFIGGEKAEPEVARETRRDTDFVRASTPEETPGSRNSEENPIDIIPEAPNANDSSTTSQSSTSPVPLEGSTSVISPSSDPVLPPSPLENDDIGKVRSNSFKFMRKIARSNQKPVLLGNQLSLLNTKIKSLQNSSALKKNINDAANNAAELQNIARSKNLKPQFLATAALARLGNNRGNVVAKAREMADILDNLNIQIGDEQADDNLIIIAAYEDGVRNQYLKMRNKLQRLAAKNPNRASEIRTIWFLKDKGEISASQFDFALRFLAIGTITQNPEAFSVKAKALSLN